MLELSLLHRGLAQHYCFFFSSSPFVSFSFSLSFSFSIAIIFKICLPTQCWSPPVRTWHELFNKSCWGQSVFPRIYIHTVQSLISSPAFTHDILEFMNNINKSININHYDWIQDIFQKRKITFHSTPLPSGQPDAVTTCLQLSPGPRSYGQTKSDRRSCLVFTFQSRISSNNWREDFITLTSILRSIVLIEEAMDLRIDTIY